MSTWTGVGIVNCVWLSGWRCDDLVRFPVTIIPTNLRLHSAPLMKAGFCVFASFCLQKQSASWCYWCWAADCCLHHLHGESLLNAELKPTNSILTYVLLLWSWVEFSGSVGSNSKLVQVGRDAVFKNQSQRTRIRTGLSATGRQSFRLYIILYMHTLYSNTTVLQLKCKTCIMI